MIVRSTANSVSLPLRSYGLMKLKHVYACLSVTYRWTERTTRINMIMYNNVEAENKDFLKKT